MQVWLLRSASKLVLVHDPNTPSGVRTEIAFLLITQTKDLMEDNRSLANARVDTTLWEAWGRDRNAIEFLDTRRAAITHRTIYTRSRCLSREARNSYVLFGFYQIRRDVMASTL